MLNEIQLGLTAEELSALLKVREMLATVPTQREEVVFDSKYSRDAVIEDPTRYVDKETINLLDGFGGFNMRQMCKAYDPDDASASYTDYYDCGTVGCIAGWIGVYMWEKPPVIGEKYVISVQNARRISQFVNEFSEYPRRYKEDGVSLSGANQLFYPAGAGGEELDTDWRAITPAHAVQAIDNFLEHGEPRWHAVLGEEIPQQEMTSDEHSAS